MTIVMNQLVIFCMNADATDEELLDYALSVFDIGKDEFKESYLKKLKEKTD